MSVQPVTSTTVVQDSTQHPANVHVISYRKDLLTRIKAAKLQVSLAQLDRQTAQANLDAAQVVLQSLTDALHKFDAEEGPLEVTSDSSDEEDPKGKGKSTSRRLAINEVIDSVWAAF